MLKRADKRSSRKLYLFSLLLTVSIQAYNAFITKLDLIHLYNINFFHNNLRNNENSLVYFERNTKAYQIKYEVPMIALF